ncbi:hypothetical protein [Nocardia macrotermitis]|uniref:Uncharacterized protein n=1 Tax=Nocardia macrotermitis TaxID=2585198 RepID=A0A7K0D7M9_9NOCA|nr:hypothetical protein [Nocardia macrotermitis]MQY21790.1 hypothetical protein [Nocardia macrotermitis]
MAGMHIRCFGAAGLCLLVVSLIGCEASPSAILKSVSTCGRFAIPGTAKLISHIDDSHFRSQTWEVVVDMPVGELSEFESRSELGSFEPGVPADWRQKYWRGLEESSVLQQNSGNEHSPPPGYPARWVVVHNSGENTRRVFIRAEC